MQLLGVTTSKFFSVGLIAVVFILFFKFVAGKTGIAGLQKVADGV